MSKKSTLVTLVTLATELNKRRNRYDIMHLWLMVNKLRGVTKDVVRY